MAVIISTVNAERNLLFKGESILHAKELQATAKKLHKFAFCFPKALSCSDWDAPQAGNFLYSKIVIPLLDCIEEYNSLKEIAQAGLKLTAEADEEELNNLNAEGFLDWSLNAARTSVLSDILIQTFGCLDSCMNEITQAESIILEREEADFLRDGV